MMESTGRLQQNRGATKQQRVLARKEGLFAPRTLDGQKLGDKALFDRLTSQTRFKNVVDSFEEEVTQELAECGKEASLVPEWMQDDNGTKQIALGKVTSGQFVELFVYAAMKGSMTHLQTTLRSRLRFYYIRLMLKGEAFEGDFSDSTLPMILKERSPKKMDGLRLDQLVGEVVAEIARRDSGILLEMVERQSFLDDDDLEADPKNQIIRDAIGGVFNVFFNWIAVIVAGDKIAKSDNVSRVAVLHELIVEYDEYVVDHVLPLARDWGRGETSIDNIPDDEIGVMAELLKGLRDFINTSMCDIMIRVEAEYAAGGDAERTNLLRLLWGFQRKSVLDVWGQGIWILEVGAPIPTMQRKRSQTTKSGEEKRKTPEVLKLLTRQRVEFEAQVAVSVQALPNLVEVTITLGNIRCRVANSSWDAAHMGHFPSYLNLTVTPLSAEALFSVNKSSANQAFKVNMSESLGLSVGVGIGTTKTGFGQGSGSVGVGVGTGSQVSTSGTPWAFEQLEEGNNGGSFNWSLTSWEGKPFDRLNPRVTEKKTSIFSFGRRPPSNPLLGLPFGSDGGILFAEEEYSEGLKWRFPKAMEGKVVEWVIEGSVDTTILSQKGYWETRTIIFEHSLEQALIPDPDEPDKKDKKKKKKKK